ncbi:MAG: hypothetical protein Q4C95_04295 [Planctomycetia bacterium]|nr:hypothetical protein [Planctomycetia bacterium]
MDCEPRVQDGSNALALSRFNSRFLGGTTAQIATKVLIRNIHSESSIFASH